MANRVPKDKPCPHCGRWHGRGITVDGVVIWQNKLLLVKRKEEPFKGFWALPGGFLDDDEDCAEAAAREVFEETGVVVIRPVFIGLFDEPGRHPKQAISLAYKFSVSGQPKLRPQTSEVSEVAFVLLAEVPKLAFDHNTIVAASLRKR
jgi:8-oxo-dGTP diphosphatase